MYTLGLTISPVKSGEELAEAWEEIQFPMDKEHLPRWMQSVEEDGYRGIFNTIFVARYKGRALGQVALRPTGPGEEEVAKIVAARKFEGQIPAINSLYVHLAHRGEGLATALMAVTHATIVLSPALADRAVLWVEKDNEYKAPELFTGLGYEVLGETILHKIPDKNRKPKDAEVLVMAKDLESNGVE